jgi:hypothetical protein
MSGPFLASVHDVTIFRKPGGLMSKIPPGKKAIGDSGYKGEPDKVSVHNTLDSQEVTRFKNRVRARHENFNGRIKSFHILDTRFRHGHAKHKTVFEAACVIMQYDIENGHPLFDV